MVDLGVAPRSEDVRVEAGEEWVDESTPLDTAPGRIGNVIEAMESLVRESGLEWLSLRGGIFVGPGTFEDDTIARLRAGTERVAGDGSNWVSPVHVADYAEAVALALESPTAHAVLNITAEPIRQRDYIDRLSALLEVPSAPLDSDAKMRQSYRCSNAAARTPPLARCLAGALSGRSGGSSERSFREQTYARRPSTGAG